MNNLTSNAINKSERKISGKGAVSSLFIDKNTAVYFDSFGIEYIPQKV